MNKTILRTIRSSLQSTCHNGSFMRERTLYIVYLSYVDDIKEQTFILLLYE
jgi:hypothetical protein